MFFSLEESRRRRVVSLERVEVDLLVGEEHDDDEDPLHHEDVEEADEDEEEVKDEDEVGGEVEHFAATGHRKYQ